MDSQAVKLAEFVRYVRTYLHFHVLDPACGSGNFLYIAYRELKRIEMDLLDKIATTAGQSYRGSVRETSVVSAGQFHGIDIKPFAVELAKVTLMLAKKLALDESAACIASGQAHLPFDVAERALPLDNLDANIRCDDALFCDWPKANAIVGNPPYQSKNKMQQEFGPDYVRKVRGRYPEVPGRADYCVYWFRRAHDELPTGGRAGLVGTNTIRQNYSREGGLDYIVANGGWLLSYPRRELIGTIGKLSRCIVCGRITKRPIFEFISSNIRPNDALQVFAFADDYSFGILQSSIHWAWFTAKCSTLTERFRYTSDTVFDTFSWPQAPTLAQARKVAAAAVSLRQLRRKAMAENNCSLRELYRSLELPGQNPLRDSHTELDAAVRAAYGMKSNDDPLAFLLALNATAAEREARGEPIVAPGLPPCVSDSAPFLTSDSIQPTQP